MQVSVYIKVPLTGEEYAKLLKLSRGAERNPAGQLRYLLLREFDRTPVYQEGSTYAEEQASRRAA